MYVELAFLLLIVVIWTCSHCLQQFLMTLVMTLMRVAVCACSTKRVSICKVCITQSFLLDDQGAVSPNAQEPLKVQDGTSDFNVRVWKESWNSFRYYTANSFWEIATYLLSFGVISKEVDSYLKITCRCATHTCVRLGFLHILKSKEHVATDWIHKQMENPA